MLDFLTLDPVPTVAAIRRAPQTGPANRSGRPAVAGTVGCARPIHVLDDAALREHAARRRAAGAGVALRIRCWQGTAPYVEAMALRISVNVEATVR